MKRISAVSLISAMALIGGSSVALAQTQGVSGAIGAGTAAAGDKGAIASGVNAAGKATDRAERRQGRERRDRDARQTQMPSASTYGAGSVYTDRNNTSAAVTSGGAATGAGANTSSTVDAYGETTRDGTSADIYGGSTAGTDSTNNTAR